MPLDLEEIILTVGYIGLFVIVFAETGLLIGFFLPGDSLLITTGVLASKSDEFSIWVLIPLLCIAAITGDAVGYAIGRRAGPRLFSKPDAKLFRRKHLERAQEFYAKHGGKTIVLARFLAFVRTFAPTVAGAAGMPYAKFTFYNVAGGIGWVVSMTLLGYFIGEAVPNLDAVLFAVIGVIVLLSVAPAGYHLWRERRAAARRAA